MAESARHLVEEVFGPRPVRQWVLSVPVPLRFLFASKPDAIGPVLWILHRLIAGWLADQAGVERSTAQGWLEGEDKSVFLSDRAGCGDGLDALRMRPRATPARQLLHALLSAAVPDAALPLPSMESYRRHPCRRRSAASRCMRVVCPEPVEGPPRPTSAKNSNAWAAPPRTRRFRKSSYPSRRRAGCVTSSGRRGRTARRTWRLSRWSLSPNSRRWYRHRVRT